MEGFCLCTCDTCDLMAADAVGVISPSVEEEVAMTMLEVAVDEERVPLESLADTRRRVTL